MLCTRSSATLVAFLLLGSCAGTSFPALAEDAPAGQLLPHRTFLDVPFNGPPVRVAVARGLNWLARHQQPTGNWSAVDFSSLCKDQTCTGAGDERFEVEATSLALLAFMGGGLTHQIKNPYQQKIRGGLDWLVSQQKNDGDLSRGQGMTAHAVATLAICEALTLTGDKALEEPAAMAIHFLSRSQGARGGWGTKPLDEGDLLTTGWNVMALQSARRARKAVSAGTLHGATLFVTKVACGDGRFSDVPAADPSPTTTAVGLWCVQSLPESRRPPAGEGDPLRRGLDDLMQHLPDPAAPRVYYWFYATQVVRKRGGPQWDTWKERVEKALVESQVVRGCAAGSWPPEPAADDVSARDRLLATALGCLTLEIDYGLLPLYKK